MGVNLSIKAVPENLAERLRQRAERNHRSLQGELMAIIEMAARPNPYAALQAESLQPLDQMEVRTASGRPLVSERRGTRCVEDLAAEHLARYPQPFTDVARAVDIIRRERDRR